MKSVLAGWIIWIIPYCIFAQSRGEIDAIVSRADSLRTEGQFSLAEAAAQLALERSQKVNYPKGTANSYMQLGRALKEQERYDEALNAYESALLYRRFQLKDTIGIAKTYNSMASAALGMGENRRAFIYSNGAMDYCPKDSVEVLAKIYNNRGNILEAIDSIERAIQINRQAMELFRLTHDTLTRLQTGYGLAKKLIGKSLFTEAKKEIDGVFSLINVVEEPDSFMLGHIYEIYGNYFLRLPGDGQPDSAIVYFQKAGSIYKNFPAPNPDLANVYFNIGEAYFAKNDLSQARDFYQKSMEALADLDNHDLYNESVNAIIGRINAQIDLEKSQKREILLRNLLILSLVIIALISMALYLNARSLLKKEKQISSQAQENTRLLEQNFQLKHDIVKNGLQAIDNHIKSEMHNLGNEDPGYSALQKMENMISRMLNKVGYPVAGTQEPTTLKPFVRELHLQAEEIFRGTQNYSFLDGVDDYPMSKILRDQLEAIVIESFTNIYKHAQCTVASLCVEVDENGLTLTIEDNGKGFEQDQVKQSGLRNIDLRAYEIKGRCKITTAPGKGSKIKIVIPGFPERPE